MLATRSQHERKPLYVALGVSMPGEARAWTYANARDCASGEAPSGYDTESCDITVNSTTFYTCGQNAFDELECDLGGSSQSNSANGTIVTDYGTATDYYSAWGEIYDVGTSSWKKFCCVDESDNIEFVILKGTAGTDTLKFSEGITASLHHNNGGTLEAIIVAKGGTDTLVGSNDASGINEYLMGMGGQDTLRGRASDDVVCADECVPDLYGGPMPSRFDLHSGGSHADTSDNFANGGPGDDLLDGAAGTDWLCDEGGTDQFLGAGGNDQMFAGALDSPSGDAGAGSNACGDSIAFSSPWATSCPLTLSSKPAQCPAF